MCQFLIVLPNTDPVVWRRIQVPESYSFWDLHVAIQDAMGWKDYHLHEFTLVDPKTGRAKRIGIPDDEMPDERPCLAGWKVPISRYLTYGTDPVRYRYDFGDDWEHTLEFEELVPAGDSSYPRCIAGAGACPPEDVGGTHGYAEFLLTIRNRGHPEREAMLRWAGVVSIRTYLTRERSFSMTRDSGGNLRLGVGVALSDTRMEPAPDGPLARPAGSPRSVNRDSLGAAHSER